LSAHQVRAFWSVCGRELLWIRPGVAREVVHWRRLAASIPDPTIRHDALTALSEKRLNIEGAALFAVLAPRRDSRLVRLLVAYQVLLDFLDSVSERPAEDPIADGLHLHLALRDALEPDGPLCDYYLHHPCRADGGYLHALVQVCRECCIALPAYPSIRLLAVEGAERCGVQGINHDPDSLRRDRTLEEWALCRLRSSWRVSWWEFTAAASSTLGIHAQLALAADPDCGEHDAAEVDAAYMPWICAASTMLDSYVDEVQDAESESHSYISHYGSSVVAVERTHELVRRSLWEARRLPGGARHALIAAGMVAMYLSCDEARSQAKRETTRRLARAGGSLPRVLLPLLRMWRVAYALRPA
jgi:tetraprenyl-beta-curcumene synthase